MNVFQFRAYWSSVLQQTRKMKSQQEGHPACKKTERWGSGMIICLERDADLHMAQLMPLPLTVPYFSKIQISFTCLVPTHPGSPGQRPVKPQCVCQQRKYTFFVRFRFIWEAPNIKNSDILFDDRIHQYWNKKLMFWYTKESLVMVVCLVTTLLMNAGGLCSYLEDVLSVKRHHVSHQAVFCASLLIHSTTSLSLTVSDFSLLSKVHVEVWQLSELLCPCYFTLLKGKVQCAIPYWHDDHSPGKLPAPFRLPRTNLSNYDLTQSFDWHFLHRFHRLTALIIHHPLNLLFLA